MKLQEGQRVRLNPSPDRDNTFGDRASIWGESRSGFLTLTGQQGTVTDVSESLARVQVDDGPMVVLDRTADRRVELLEQVIVDLSQWELLGKLDRFAKDHKLTRDVALLRLAERALDGI